MTPRPLLPRTVRHDPCVRSMVVGAAPDASVEVGGWRGTGVVLGG